jgi:hypothetical protein
MNLNGGEYRCASIEIYLTEARRHAFADLRPYVCIVEDCDADHMDFSSRTEFAAHLLKHQCTKLWRCTHCGHTGSERTAIETHIARSHPALASKSRESAIEEKNVVRDLSTEKCPFCQDIPGISKFVGHLCHHLEEISLSAVPRNAELEDEDQENSTYSGRPRLPYAPSAYSNPGSYKLLDSHIELDFPMGEDTICR